MLELNLSVKVLDRKAPYLFVWWNEHEGCADGFLVTCECQGLQLKKDIAVKKETVDKSSDWYGNVAKALELAEIVTVHPERSGKSLCKLSDVVAVKKDAKKGKRKKKHKRKKKTAAKIGKGKDVSDDHRGSDKNDVPENGEMDVIETNGEDEAKIDEQEEQRNTTIGDQDEEINTTIGDPDEESNTTIGDQDEERKTIMIYDDNIQSEIELNESANCETRMDITDLNDDNEITAGPSNSEDDVSVAISVSCMSQTIKDMLSSSDKSPQKLAPTISVSSPPPEPDLEYADPETIERIAQLKALKDKKYLVRYNKKLSNRRLTFMLCEICGAAVCNKSYKTHVEAVHYKGQREGLHSCNICHKTFLYPANVKRHMLIHANVRFPCRFCGTSFAQPGARSLHEKTKHNKGEPVIDVTKLIVKKKRVTKLTTWSDFTVVNRAANIVQCNICDKKLKKASMKPHMDTHDPLGVSCPICHKHYSTPSSLRIHSQVHKEKKFQCTICGKRFHYNTGMVIHMRIHSDDKPLPCRHCGERFSRYQARINHERRHTGEKPYSCTICVKDWRDRTTYLSHMKRHHPNVPVMTLKKQYDVAS